MKRGLDLVVLLAVDLLMIALCLEFSILIRKEILPFFMEFPEFRAESFLTFWWVFPIWISFFAYEGLFTRRFSFWDEIKQLWKAIFFATIAVFKRNQFLLG